MPRPPRIFVPGAYYHVTLRGNHQEALFGSPDDRDALDAIVADAIKRHAARVHAYCWMTNHLHAVVQISDRPLGALMQSIAMQYSRHRHKVLCTTGHLFERRYWAKVIDVDSYFLAALRYVHLNPVAACLVDDAGAYPWSSHRAFLGLRIIPWLTTDFGLAMFDPDIAKARRGYAEFMSAHVASEGEWPAPEPTHAPEKSRNGTQPPTHTSRSAGPPASTLTLSQFADAFCSEYCIGIDVLRARTKTRSVTAIRAEFAARAVELHQGTLSEVARFLQRDACSLSRLIARHHIRRR
jgi:putative transposase